MWSPKLGLVPFDLVASSISPSGNNDNDIVSRPPLHQPLSTFALLLSLQRTAEWDHNELPVHFLLSLFFSPPFFARFIGLRKVF
jgi:hypothetical protein